MENEIDLNADFLTFQNQITEKFGNQYSEQSELFFERSTALAEQGLLHSAISEGKFALELSYFSENKLGIPYLIGFLSQLHCELGKIRKANAYYELGLKLLDEESPDYEDDKEMFCRLKEHIDSEGWKGSLD
jgi:hypothetical protein